MPPGATALAVLVGLVLRGFLLWQFPFFEGDSHLYSALAYNLLDHGVYGIWYKGALLPVDIRMPGYPLFLAGIAALFGRGADAVAVVQAGVDVASCLLAALLAYRLAPEAWRVRAAMITLWLTALCPFTANYTVTPLAEAPAIFCTLLALVLLADGRWIEGGMAAGVGCLFRPETPLLLAAGGLYLLAARCWRELIPASLKMTLGVALVLTPWAIRNGITLHEIQFLAPPSATLPSEEAGQGFYAWTGTWLWRAKDINPFIFAIEEEPIAIEALPAEACDSPAERARAIALLERYNEDTQLTPAIDGGFAELARERRARNPLHAFVIVPLLRVWTLWFTPRTELLPFSGETWDTDPVDFTVTTTFRMLNFLYLGMGLAGLWLLRRNPLAVLPLAYILLRTALMTLAPAPEPRYVVPCFPPLLALGSLLLCPWWRRASL